MTIKIGFANYAGFFQFIEKLRPELPEDVEVIILNDLFSELESSVRRIEAEGSVDVFVASGGNSEYMQRYLKTIPMVKVKITGFDLMNAIREASQFSTNIAVITHSPIPYIEELKSVLRVELMPLQYQTPEDLSLILQSLYAGGIRDVIGTALVLEQAKMYDLRGHFIWSLDSVRDAVSTAIDMARTRKALTQKAKMLDYIMDYSAEGIIVTDKNGIITHLNNSGERILSRSRRTIVGRQCAEVLPNTQLHTVMREKRAQFNRIQDMGNVKIVTNRSPIIVNKEVIGALATFFSTSTIKQAGDNIRRSQGDAGFIAHADFTQIRTEDAQFARLLKQAEKYSKSSSTILITGEIGSGKTTLAQCIHNASYRKNENFVRVNCSAIPLQAFEGALFGYEEGAYRKQGNIGLIEHAHQGTLFLDEISELPLNIQAAIMNVLEEKQFFRIGSTRSLPIDIRVIASTNKDLKSLVREGLFREDLYYEVDVLNLNVPSLRERNGDIPLLIKDLLNDNRSDLTRSEQERICHAMPFLEHDWPGNIRELKKTIERFCVLFAPGADVAETAESVLRTEAVATYGNNERENSRREILEALSISGGSKNGAAEVLGISRTTLWRKMRELGMMQAEAPEIDS